MLISRVIYQNLSVLKMSLICVCCLSWRTGDLSLLDTHAVVSCNNESFSDNDPQTNRLLDRAGPELRQELLNSVRGGNYTVVAVKEIVV